MFCSISGSVPEQPVVSTKSGHVFERRLVEKFVRETGKCPITSESLALDDLLPLKASKAVKPRTAPATSIPGLLGLFHDEWDAVMLEAHTLRQQLHSVRQELCHALYQHDAATRVIARLMRERDEARAALEQARESIVAEAAKRPQAAAQEEAAKRQKVPTIPEEVLQELQDVNQQLSKQRKKREISRSLATPEDLAQLALHSSTPLHKTTQPGITAIQLSPDGSSSVVATGGADATVQLFDHAEQRIVASLEGHTKRITGLQFVSPGVLITSSADKTARIWRAGTGADAGAGFSCAATLRDHSGEVVGVTLHPSRKFFVTGSSDASWNFYDLDSATLLRLVRPDEGGAGAGKEGYTTLQFHPDGLILGTATESCSIRIWEVKQQKNVATFSEHTKAVKALAFSENGYHLASAGEDGVKVWDLRKLKVLKSLSPYEDAGCSAAVFDLSGQYLGVGGADARIYNVKQDWSVVRTFTDVPKKGVLSLQFGPDAKSLFVGAADHNLRIYTLPA